MIMMVGDDGGDENGDSVKEEFVEMQGQKQMSQTTNPIQKMVIEIHRVLVEKKWV